MKRLFITLIALFTLTTAEAQWLDALKKVATEAIDKATDGKLTQMAVIGTWNYTAPAVKLEGDNALSNIGGSAISATVGDKLEQAFTKVGISSGFCSMTFNEDGTYTMPVKGRQIKGTYTYNSSDHSLTLKVGQSGKVEVKGYAYISGTNLQIVFPINKLTDFMVAIGSSIKSLNSITKLIEQYENIYLGFEFAK